MTHELAPTLHQPSTLRGSSDFLDAESFPCSSTLDDLIHELRQPLSTIESLTYCLELTASDVQTRQFLEHIQAMVLQAHRILERASDRVAL